jgi:hypothetical protein
MAGRRALGFGGRQPSMHSHGEAALLGPTWRGAPWLPFPVLRTIVHLHVPLAPSCSPRRAGRWVTMAPQDCSPTRLMEPLAV